MEKLKVLIVDDELPARKKISSILSDEYPSWIIDEAKNGVEAVSKINQNKPDIVFLDIQMPGLNGFEVIIEIGIKNMPVVIFVTAYDQYAIKAFEVQAIDYLLKPFDKTRMIKAIDQAQTRLGKSFDQNQEIISLINSITKKTTYKSRLMIKDGAKHFFINTKDINQISVKEKYLDIHSKGKVYLLRDTITSMENQLDPEIFKRVNRSTIINLNNIVEIQPWSHGDYIIILDNKEKIKLSRKYSQNILENN